MGLRTIQNCPFPRFYLSLSVILGTPVCLGCVPPKAPVPLSESALHVHSKDPTPPHPRGQVNGRSPGEGLTEHALLAFPFLFSACALTADGYLSYIPSAGLLTVYNGLRLRPSSESSPHAHHSGKYGLRGLGEPMLTTESAPQGALTA